MDDPYAFAPDRERRLAGLRLLLAEDSWIIAEALKEALRHEGAIVSGPAATVAEARALANASDYDVAVFDVNLRGELATGLIKELVGRGIGVVVLSGYSVDPHLEALVGTVLEKPVATEQLILAITSHGRSR